MHPFLTNPYGYYKLPNILVEEIDCFGASIRSSKTPTLITHYKEDNKIADQFNQPPPPLPRRHRSEYVPRETCVDLPHFLGKNNEETYKD